MALTTEPSIRTARDSDTPALTSIYNHYVEHTPITFDTESWPVDRRREWLKQFAEKGPRRILVAEDAGVVVGYACSAQFRAKPAYDTTVETTVYLQPETHGRGIGRALYGALFDAIRDEDLHRAIAMITLPNEASVGLHEAFGFTHKGTLHEVGRKFDRFWDVGWYEKPLP